MSLKEIKKAVKEQSNKEQGVFLQRFFKTGHGEYGEGDKFAGIKVPASRKIAQKNLNVSLNEIKELLKSKIHEERLIALLVLVEQFKKGDEAQKEKIFKFYFKNSKYINNWDLVDLSAPQIVGSYLLNKEKDLIFDLAKSTNLWEKRISIISTLSFIRVNDFKATFKIAKILLNDEHDLIHKAVGWMHREVGNRDLNKEEEFLKKYYKKMPRTMLRYAIEKFPEAKRQDYLKNKI
ncbi:MAG: DNA alkylation repair protein [Ignavibacteriaceae bacterium]